MHTPYIRMYVRFWPTPYLMQMRRMRLKNEIWIHQLLLLLLLLLTHCFKPRVQPYTVCGYILVGLASTTHVLRAAVLNVASIAARFPCPRCVCIWAILYMFVYVYAVRLHMSIYVYVCLCSTSMDVCVRQCTSAHVYTRLCVSVYVYVCMSCVSTKFSASRRVSKRPYQLAADNGMNEKANFQYRSLSYAWYRCQVQDDGSNCYSRKSRQAGRAGVEVFIHACACVCVCVFERLWTLDRLTTHTVKHTHTC
jgi:hypothetical protein